MAHLAHERRVGPGSLTVVGTGICVGAQLTPEARRAIQTAEVALCLAPDPVALRWLRTLKPAIRSLNEHYRVGEHRSLVYERIADAIVDEVRQGRTVCAVFYGHPGVFVDPSHEAIRRVRAEGLPARMLPGISAEDCLFADLGVDPGRSGCQSYEATDFLLRRRAFDPTAALLLWQIAAIGFARHGVDPPRSGLPLVVERLRPSYGDAHRVILYEASPFPIADPVLEEVSLAELAEAKPTPAATLYVPPLEPRPVDDAMLQLLGLG